jgi:hypothetical protein
MEVRDWKIEKPTFVLSSEGCHRAEYGVCKNVQHQDGSPMIWYKLSEECVGFVIEETLLELAQARNKWRTQRGLGWVRIK